MKSKKILQNSRRNRNIWKKELKRKELRRLLKKLKNNKRVLESQLRNKYSVKKKNPGRFKIVPPPKDFSLLTNPEEVLNYFEINRKLLADGYSVCFDLSTVENLTYETIALLLAKIKDIRFIRGLKIAGTAPKKEPYKSLFLESGFYEYVRSKAEIPESKGRLFNHVSDTHFSEEICLKLCEDLMTHTLKWKKKKYQFLQPVLGECMGNTTNHAGNIDTNKKCNWWVFSYKNPKNFATQMCFLDLGVGIFGSLNSKLENWGMWTGVTSNADKLIKIFNKELKFPTRTRQKKRGQGLLTMYDFAKRPEVKDFTIISNNVYGRVSSEDNIKALNINFSGTLICWEIHPIKEKI